MVFLSSSLTVGRHDSLGESFYFGFVFAFSLHNFVARFHCTLSLRTFVAHFPLTSFPPYDCCFAALVDRR